MNENWYKYYRPETRRRQNEIKQAEIYRMWKSGSPDTNKSSKKLQRLVIALGVKLVKWGQSLRDRYEDPSTALR